MLQIIITNSLVKQLKNVNTTLVMLCVLNYITNTNVVTYYNYNTKIVQYLKKYNIHFNIVHNMCYN